jgi:1,4-alpha-glucan branching enzyme
MQVMVSIREDGRVEFKFYRPGAIDVRIAGDFDNWSGSLNMRNAGRGWWIFDADLPPGEYRFRYQADGQWYTDFAAYGVEHTKTGWNSVVIVPEMEIEAAVGETAGTETEYDLETARIAA